MVKYIPKQETISALINEANTHKNPIKRAYARAAAIIEQIPATDIQPVKHGVWKFYKNNGIYDTYKCSICKESFELSMDADISQEIRYCPNCGARMDLKDGDIDG